jgi:DNA mismatch repair ATPase MutS
LRGWLSTPFYSRDKILERQDGVEMVTRSCNAEFVGDLVKLLRHTHDLPKLLLR